MTADDETRDFTIFYSSQSDLPAEATRNVIRHALRDASSLIEVKYAKDNLRVVIDEATRGEPGSPNIPATIMDKINIADAFVCDVTPVTGEPVWENWTGA